MRFVVGVPGAVMLCALAAGCDAFAATPICGDRTEFLDGLADKCGTGVPPSPSFGGIPPSFGRAGTGGFPVTAGVGGAAGASGVGGVGGTGGAGGAGGVACDPVPGAPSGLPPCTPPAFDEDAGIDDDAGAAPE